LNEAVHFIKPEDLAAIDNLELLARTVVEGFMSGLHRSPHSGSSIEFAQYRPYAQGDDLRNIDWHLFGRTDRLHIKQYEEETSLRCTLLLDCSGSMDYSSHAVTKFDYARMLTACLAMLLQRQRDSFGLIAYHREILDYVPPRSGNLHLRRIFVELEGIAAKHSTDTAGALAYLGDVLRPRGMVILVSDLLHPVEEVVHQLKSLRARRQDVIVIQVSDPAERMFPFDESATLVDAESGQEQFAVPDAVREQYLENRRNHFETIRRECLAAEIDIEEFSTDEPLDRALHFFLHNRNRFGVGQRGAGSASSAGGVA
jgi:uncharacterized protein (DUF58 family)